jgi:hypothetical protein
MKTQSLCTLLVLGLACSIAPIHAQTPAEDVTAAMQGQLAADVLEGCKTELTQYCSDVTPGEGRLLACIFAYGDKLSAECEVALYDASVRLERAVNAVTLVASECSAELEAHCKNVQTGEGRVAQCLKDNQSSLGQSCSQALADVGLK